MQRSSRVVLATLVAGLAIPSGAAAATYNVTTTADNAAATCASAAAGCSLRGAIDRTNADSSATGTTINLPAGTFTLATGLDLDPTKAKTVDIQGNGADTTIVKGPGNDSAFSLTPSSGTSMYDLTISGGVGTGGHSGAIDSPGGSLQLGNVKITGNRATATGTDFSSGGGIAVYKTPSTGNPSLSISDSLISGNSVTGSNGTEGGGVYFDGGTTGKLLLDSDTFSANTAGTGAASYGGGVSINAGAITITNSTFNANAATNGAAIATSTGASVSQSTISANTGNSGVYDDSGATVSLRSSIVDQGTIACAGTFSDAGGNLDSGTSCKTGGLTSTDPKLSALALDVTGTLVMIPKPGSPAIDAAGTTCPTAGDQRYSDGRPTDGDGDGIAKCDAGAVEYGPPAPSNVASSGVTASAATVKADVIQPDVAGNLRVEFGPTTAYGSSTAGQDVAPSIDTLTRTFALGGLAASTTYHYRVLGTDGARTFSSGDLTFRTAAAPAPPVTTTPVTPVQPVSPPAPSQVGLKLGALKAFSLKKASSGYTVSATCTSACTVRAKFTVSAKTAKKLKSKSRTLATATGSGKSVKLKLGKTVAARLRKAKVTSLTLSVTATPKSSAIAAAVVTKTVKLTK